VVSTVSVNSVFGVMLTLAFAGAACASHNPQETAVAARPEGSCHAHQANPADGQAWLPDTQCTPGAVDGGLPAAKLCPRADTKPIRPPSSYTTTLKTQQMRAYGFTDPISAHEEDHVIPLELGGAPRDPQNLWPEPGSAPNEKDQVENATHDAVCTGKLTLGEAQRRMATDWYQLGKDLRVIKSPVSS